MQDNWQGWELAQIDAARRRKNVFGIAVASLIIATGISVVMVLEDSPKGTVPLSLVTIPAIGLLVWLAKAGHSSIAAGLLVSVITIASTSAVLATGVIGPAPSYIALALLMAVVTLRSQWVLAAALGGALSLGVMAWAAEGVVQTALSPVVLISNAVAVFLATAVIAVLHSRGHEQAVRQGIHLADARKQIYLEHERLADELERVRRMEALGRLAGGVAHDFNNLLLIVQASSEYAQTLTRDGEILRELRQVEAAADRGAQLTRSLLAFARRQVLETQNVDLVSVVSDLLPLLTTLVGPSVLIKVQGEGPAVVRCTVTQLEQVLMNLSANARDAMPQGGHLTIRVASVGDDEAETAGLLRQPHALLEVSDTGEGIPAEHLDKIFEPFFTTKLQGAGTGLGLSTSIGIAEQLGGRLLVESTEGTGTTLRLWLPLLVGGEPVDFSEEVRTSGTPLRLGTVLVVDDEPELLRLTARVFEPHAHTVLAAAGVKEALAFSDRHPDGLDYILSDIVLKGGESGIDLARVLLERQPRAALTLMSGFVGDHEGLPADLAARVTFVAKPFNNQRALLAAREALKRRSVEPEPQSAQPADSNKRESAEPIKPLDAP